MIFNKNIEINFEMSNTAMIFIKKKVDNCPFQWLKTFFLKLHKVIQSGDREEEVIQ